MAIEVKGRYHTSAPTYNVNGQIGYLELDSRGNLKVTLETGALNLGSVLAEGSTDGGTTLYPLKVDSSGNMFVKIQGSSDGGTTWYPIAVSSSGAVSSVISSITAAKLASGQVTAEDVTCATANLDYHTVNAIPANTKYVTVSCPNACTVAMGEVTHGNTGSAPNLFDPVLFDPAIFGPSTTSTMAVGVNVGAGVPTTFPVSATDVTNGLYPHCQSPTAGSVVRFCYMKD